MKKDVNIIEDPRANEVLSEAVLKFDFYIDDKVTKEDILNILSKSTLTLGMCESESINSKTYTKVITGKDLIKGISSERTNENCIIFNIKTDIMTLPDEIIYRSTLEFEEDKDSKYLNFFTIQIIDDLASEECVAELDVIGYINIEGELPNIDKDFISNEIIETEINYKHRSECIFMDSDFISEIKLVDNGITTGKIIVKFKVILDISNDPINGIESINISHSNCRSKFKCSSFKVFSI